MPLYRFDTTDPSRWDELVAQPALAVARAVIAGATPPATHLVEPPSREGEQAPAELGPGPFSCDACGGQVFLTPVALLQHQKGRKHQRLSRARRAAAARGVD